MKLQAEIIVKDEHGVEITRFTREETRQSTGCSNITVHEFNISFSTVVSKEIENTIEELYHDS